MIFSPISASKDITDTYKRYLRTIFQIADEDYARQFDQELERKDILAKGPYLDAVDAFEKGKSLNQLIAEGVVPRSLQKLDFPMDRPLYRHQENAIRKCRAGNNVVVSTGTGSGKTESFLMPVLSELAAEDEAGRLTPGIRALLIYPMNALANDQMERLRELLQNYPAITFGSYTGQTENKESAARAEYRKLNKGREPLPNELISRERMIETPPNILITNYAMLEYLMVRPRESSFFSGKYAQDWKFIILDEAHVYKGSTGIEVSMLLRRVKGCLPVSRLQYILTSATLGSEDQNQEVADFATRLCASEFKEENVIRASRMVPDRKEESETRRNMEEYHALAQAIQNDDADEIARILNQRLKKRVLADDDLHDVIYDYVLKDGNYWAVRELLKENPHTVGYLASHMGCTQEQIVDFITVAAYGIRQGGQLLDAKYHMFIRATDSAFVTLPPSKKLMLTRNRKITDNGEDYQVFEIAVCRFCHRIYLTGTLDEDWYFVQSGETVQGKRCVIYLGDTLSEEIDEEKKEIQKIRICPHCGKVMPWSCSQADRCEHDQSSYVTGYLIEKPLDEVATCVACGNRAPTGTLRPFFTGQEAVTSVIGTALFQALPSTRTLKQKIEVPQEDFDFDEDETTQTATINEDTAKQFIAFSDNRQAAAFYASYLTETYEGLLYKRLIVETLQRENTDDTLGHFVSTLQGYFEHYNVLDERDQDRTYKKEAWKAVLAEMVGLSNANALQNLGLMEFYINTLPCSKRWNLTSDDVNGIVEVFLTTMMTDAAIKYPVVLNQDDKEFFTHNGHEGKFTLSDSSPRGVSAFMPTKANGSNRRLDYLQRVIRKIPEDDSKSDDDIRKFLESIWNLLIGEKHQVLTLENNGYQINSEKIRVRARAKFYRCPVCGKITPYNVHGVCPSYRCSGELEEVDLSKELKDNHYYRLVQNMEIRKLRVVEHTAQLSREKAYEYQNLFKEKKIDVLSCSTTFELGVDVGSLETVFMRNMPPSPANYAQRAGRAGRSIKSVAYALTFCNKSNHDFSYFNAPETMIRGRINPPIFKVENDKIAIRHVYASTFAFFWKVHREYFKDACTMIEPGEDGKNGIDVLKEYLLQKPENLKQYLMGVLPPELVRKFDVEHYGWLERFIGEHGALIRAANEYNDEISKLQESLKIAMEGKGGSVAFIQQRIQTFQREDILSFLSRKNVMPKYGFPVDTVELSIYDQDRRSGNRTGNKLQLDLQRDLSMALSEYAPGSQIIADGHLITSRYIRKVPNMAWRMYDYKYCDCTTLNVDQHIDYKDPKHLATCHACGADLSEKPMRTFIVPEFGFVANRVEKATLMKPKRSYNSEIAYVGFHDGIVTKPFVSGNRKYEMIFGQNEEMAVLNRSNFYVCDVCGYTEVNRHAFLNEISKEHAQPTGAKCSNAKLRKYSLGYRFQTDVIQIRFTWPELSEYDQALSVLYGMMRGICSCLNIEQSDIASCLQYYRNPDTRHNSFEIILYDNTPGGSGHVKRLNDQKTFEEALRETYRIVNNCTCGGERKDTSCYNCLRTYANQRYHNLLQRRYVLDFLNAFFDKDLGSVEEMLKKEAEEEMADHEPVMGASPWDEVNELLLYSEEAARAFAQKARNAGIVAPDAVDYELSDENGNLLAEIEIAWVNRKIGYLTEEQADYAGVLKKKGWTIFSSTKPFDQRAWQK
ncbi:MAG: DEAD/DEAH box helicase [Lachnospiraceae bacterium]|jgi:ATP-dependent helicase YprA (DUF1998 family)